ncbi:MAG: hypothetical protein PVH19_02950 [Planctomycetia bacterium]
MELKFGNILGGFTLITCIWLFVKMKAEILETLATVFKTGPGNEPIDQLRGCIVIGLITGCYVDPRHLDDRFQKNRDEVSPTSV